MSKKFYRVFTDEDYDRLKVQPRCGEYMDDESMEKMVIDKDNLITIETKLKMETNC